MTARIDHAVTTGTFSLDGGTWEVDNNVWVVGDDSECIVIDAPHDADAVAEVVGERRLLAVLDQIREVDAQLGLAIEDLGGGIEQFARDPGEREPAAPAIPQRNSP